MSAIEAATVYAPTAEAAPGPALSVQGVSHTFGSRKVLDEVSFSVGRGQIVGLLGKNGAGKSTILKVLSCFLPATSGSARVAGYDVFHEADDVRRRIGYMPENNPLHMDMRVKEYLKFRARLKGLSMSETRELWRLAVAALPRLFAMQWIFVAKTANQ